MKKQLFILVMSSIALFSCKNNNDIETIVTVKLNPSFILLNEVNNEPMKVKSDGLTKMNSTVITDSVVYAIQVYENDAPSYYGLFNDVSKMQLALTTSKIYKFKVSAYKAGTGKGLKAVIDTAGTNYFLPNKTPLKNKFIKGDALKDIDLASSVGLNTTTKAYPEVDAFYSTKTLTLDKGTTSIDFTLLRMGFGINFTVDALNSGNMEIYLGNDTLKLNSTKATTYTIRQFATSTNTFTNINTNANTFGDSIAITAKWISTSGTIVTAAGKYKFLRNYQKTINIQLNTTVNSFNFEGWANFPTNGLVAWYPFNGNANDESGNGNNGTILGTLTQTLDRFGAANKAYNFNGTGCVKLTSINLTTFTLSAWVKRTGTGLNIISKWNSMSNNSSYILYGMEDTKLSPRMIFNDISNNWTSLNSTSTWTDNKWHMITSTLSSSALSIYFDGKLEAQTSGGIPKATTYPTIIGGGYDYSGTIGNDNLGSIDDVGFWTRTLSQDEITALYNAR